MTLQQLEYIIALDTYRHFVTAAEKTFVTQPTLTMQVQKLEEEIGVKIFDRKNKPLRPTKAGEQIVLKARQILREVNQLKAFVAKEKDLLEGEFRIGIIPTLAPYLLPLFLKDFTTANPKTKLHIKEMQTADILKSLKDDTLDIGLLVTPTEDKQIREIPMFNEPFLIYLPKDHPLTKAKNITPGEIDSHKMLILDEGHCFRNQTLNICEPSEHSDIAFHYESGSIEALRNLVKQGIGYTLVPELAVLDELQEPNIRRFDKPEPIREVSLVVHNSFTKELLLELLRKSILKNVPDRFSKNERYLRVKWR